MEAQRRALESELISYEEGVKKAKSRKARKKELERESAAEERRKADDTARTLGSERAELDAKLRRLENQLANAEAKLAAPDRPKGPATGLETRFHRIPGGAASAAATVHA